jgi:hypothetical protein
MLSLRHRRLRQVVDKASALRVPAKGAPTPGTTS